MSLPASAQAALRFQRLPGLGTTARLLMQWGEQLAPLSDSERCKTIG